MLSLWKRLPVVVRAVLIGLFVAAAGTTPWALLVSANTRHWSTVPWAVPPAALWLWLFWWYVRGGGWPRSTAATRRANCRANRVPEDVWGPAIVAGILGIVAVVLFQGVLSRLVRLPQQRDIDPSQFPLLTVVSWVLMSALVAGVTEEASFRGYLQRPIERRHGPVVAILVTGVLFGFMHFSHPEVTLVLMPFYLSVAAVYGALACLTDSIYPSMVLHAGGNVLGALQLFASGRSEWQASSAPQRLIWETGPDASFWMSVAATVVMGAAAVWGYTALATAARTARTVSGREADEAGQA